MHPIKKASVIIVRESDATGGCICCAGGMGEFSRKDPSYDSIRKVAEECGKLHRNIREVFGEDRVEIIQIEPRAYMYLMPKILKEVLRFKPSLSLVIRTLFFLYPVPTVIVNGKPIGMGRVPSIEEVVEELKSTHSL
ncbi:MAG: hypothetical protein KatS3mg078_1381 [Deltaproteobacteria bacterium]|nr:MAG: hypothetical protein KatS3mg078_1381 [Deltaproteobacteria bacterium]